MRPPAMTPISPETMDPFLTKPMMPPAATAVAYAYATKSTPILKRFWCGEQMLSVLCKELKSKEIN